MILTYGITILIVGTWVYKMISEKAFVFKKTPLDIPLLLFLGANILSTIFSIDPHTSIWGYYSRSNGGLLSLISYLALYFAFVSNMNWSNVKTLLKFSLASGFIISFWAILEHFGISFSCVLLRGQFNDSCWVQDVQARVFATLGQPNWLAAYLSMLIFPAIYLFLSAITRFHVIYYILLLNLYLAFTFTYSRGPSLGLIGGLVVFIALYLRSQSKRINSKLLLIVMGSFLAVNIFFGSALTSFRLVSKFAAPARPVIALPQTSTTQLENGGTESGQIRFIVWEGALNIWKTNPILGTGLETFAYSYYQYRPASHNLTSEWDFLYNKAHNEYLNYLATTGLVGFLTYIGVIGTFVIWCIKYYVLCITRKKHNTYYLLLTTSLLASYISYLIYNFFLFSVVIIAIFFYLFPALVFVATESTTAFSFQLSAFRLIYKRPFYTRIAKVIVVLLTVYLIYSVIKIWTADTIFNQGEKASETGNPGKAYNFLSQAVDLNTSEPFYRSELAFSAAQAAAALEQTDATLSAALKDEATAQMGKVLSNSPKNVSFYRTAIRTYFELASIDQTLKAIDKAISLAPTDPKLYYNKALVLDTQGKVAEELKVLDQALKLKPDYLEAIQQLKDATASAKSK